jgi:histidinol-phosphate phosphatase family protein
VTRPRRGLFLDRDGVLNERPPAHDYLRSSEQFRWLPGVPEAIARLSSAGFVPIVVSNQRGIARALVSWSTLASIERVIQRGLSEYGGSIAAFYYCPHDIHEGCRCRKPAPGLLLRAAAEHRLDLGASAIVGDSETDVQAGRAAGCLSIQVAEPGEPSTADVVVAGLPSAADYLLDERRR